MSYSFSFWSIFFQRFQIFDDLVPLILNYIEGGANLIRPFDVKLINDFYPTIGLAILFNLNRNRLYFPNIFAIFSNSAIAGKLTHPCHIQNWHSRPIFAIAVGFTYLINVSIQRILFVMSSRNNLFPRSYNAIAQERNNSGFWIKLVVISLLIVLAGLQTKDCCEGVNPFEGRESQSCFLQKHPR